MVRGPSARNLSHAVPLALALVCAAPAPAQPGADNPASTVSGYVWDAANRPVTKVIVVLRNLGTAHIEGTMTTDENGHVVFRVPRPGTYVLEVMDAHGAIIAAGQTFGIDVGESVATFVRLPARSPWYSGFFNNAGTIAVATAAAIGATAVGTTGQPRSPGQ